MSAPVKPGMVLLPSAAGSHPHVVLSAPSGPQRQVLDVNWTSLDNECIDDACVLQPGDNPFITHASTMAYSRAHLWHEDKILFALENQSVAALAPVAPTVLQRMLAGAHKSRELRAEWKNLIPPP